MEEIWKDIKGYEGMYQVSNLGRVKSFKKGKESILKNRENRGYKSICLSIGDNKFKGFSVHRLVALAFLGENNLPVNHINGNK
jgi:hypothetical protein